MPGDNNNGAFAPADVPGSEKVSQALKEKVVKIASGLGTNPLADGRHELRERRDVQPGGHLLQRSAHDS